MFFFVSCTNTSTAEDNYSGHKELCAFRIDQLKSLDLSGLICISTLLLNNASNFYAPKTYLGKKIT